MFCRRFFFYYCIPGFPLSDGAVNGPGRCAAPVAGGRGGGHPGAVVDERDFLNETKFLTTSGYQKKNSLTDWVLRRRPPHVRLWDPYLPPDDELHLVDEQVLLLRAQAVLLNADQPGRFFFP